MCWRLPGTLQRCQHARTDSRKSSGGLVLRQLCRPRAGTPLRGPIFRRPVVMGPAFAGTTALLTDQSNSNGIAIKMLLEKVHRQCQRAVRLRLGIGLAAVAREGV